MKVYVADYIGDKFGRLTIIADAGKSKNNRVIRKPKGDVL